MILSIPIMFIYKVCIKNNILELQKYFPKFEIAYAIKANSHKGLLKVCKKSKISFDVASIGEIQILKNLNIPSSQMLFSNPIKSVETIQYIKTNGIKYITVDSITELEKIQKYYGDTQDLNIVLRLSVSNQGSQWPLSKKFGVSLKESLIILKYMHFNNMVLSGITFHVGSQNTSLLVWKQAFKQISSFLKLANKYQNIPTILNLGGGFPISDVMTNGKSPKINKIAGTIHKEIKKLSKKNIFFQRIIIEPGRFIAGTSADILSQVIGTATRKRKKWIYINIGLFQGLMETIGGIKYKIQLMRYNKEEESKEEKEESVILAGASCDSLDKLFKVSLAPIKLHDYLIFQNAGAYTVVYSSTFNQLPEMKVITLEERPKSIEKLIEKVDNKYFLQLEESVISAIS